MTILKEEFRKIASRTILWVGIFTLLFFVAARLFIIVKDEYKIVIDGTVYQGLEAIKKDKELMKEYEGILTMEKVQEIYQRFGFYYDDEEDRPVGNFCNQFITEHMTNYNQTDGRLSSIHFYEGEEWDKNAAYLLKGDTVFAYTYGWKDLWEMWMFVGMGLLIVFLLAFAPLFSEEYTLGTADLLLTTKHGKKKEIWLKLLAAWLFSVVVTIGTWLFLAVLYCGVFGLDGLNASRTMIDLSWIGFQMKTVKGNFLFAMGLFLAGLPILLAMTAFVSSCCKSSFLSLIVSMVLFLIPMVWVKVFASMRIFGYQITRVINHFMASMPILLPLNWGYGFTGKSILVHLGIASIFTILGGGMAYHKYRNYQG